MRRVTTLGAAALLLAGLALANVGQARPFFGQVHGRPGGPGGPGPAGPHIGLIEEYAEELGLDEKTLEQIRAIVDESRARGEDIRAALQDAHGGLRELLDQDAPDFDTAMSQLETIGALEIEQRKNRLAAMLRIRQLLTPEQRATLSTIREEARSRRLAPLMQACGADLEVLCPDAEPGRAMTRCLREQREQLSEGCRAALSEHGPRGAGRPGPRAP